ncbi:hypothetical protein TNCV_674081 [Trichonephila clavipes]|uniref:Uncharacterized protein n=1 Tax=Trichonephila clavipes TaxID=2585209 RepID=A0A8X6WD14_TRICX|nr:hypothetical protein TNCV_674081 [Trichonephila clavipes]
MSSQPVYFAHANVFHHQDKPVPIELAIATIPSDGSDHQVMDVTVNHAGLSSTPHELLSKRNEHKRLRLVHAPLPKSVPVEYLSFCVRGKLSQMGRGGFMVVKRTEQQKVFPELRMFAMTLETLPEFNDIYDGIFPNSLHEEVYEGVWYCTMDGKDPDVICLTVGHSNLLTTFKDRRASRYINERLNLKCHLPGSVPLEYLSFCVRGKFCHLAHGNKGLIVVKGSVQRKFFEKLGLFTINLEMLPHFRDLNDRTLPDHLHDEVHEDISECTMVKSYLFARYLQHFNKLQAECKKQTAHLVE